MYKRNEISQAREEFWKRLGQYMIPVQPVGNNKVNWLNYRTGIKGILFKMEAGLKDARISIQITEDAPQREKLYERFSQLKKVFNKKVEGEWLWINEKCDENGKTISVIETVLEGVNVFEKNDWPAIISFFKSGMMGLDNFWTSVQVLFDTDE